MYCENVYYALRVMYLAEDIEIMEKYCKMSTEIPFSAKIHNLIDYPMYPEWYALTLSLDIALLHNHILKECYPRCTYTIHLLSDRCTFTNTRLLEASSNASFTLFHKATYNGLRRDDLRVSSSRVPAHGPS